MLSVGLVYAFKKDGLCPLLLFWIGVHDRMSVGRCLSDSQTATSAALLGAFC